MNQIVTIVFVIAYFAAAIRLVRGVRLRTKELCICAAVIAMTLVLESFTVMLPTGASIPLCSPVPLILLALLVDGRLAVVSGWICGVFALFLFPEWQLVHWGQFFVEHMVCFSCLGFSSVFGTDRRWKILCGIALASAIQITGHLLSGVLFFSQNAWSGWGAWGYSLAYNLSQNVPLCVLSGAIILTLPLNSMKKAIGGNCA